MRTLTWAYLCVSILPRSLSVLNVLQSSLSTACHYQWVRVLYFSLLTFKIITTQVSNSVFTECKVPHTLQVFKNVSWVITSQGLSVLQFIHAWLKDATILILNTAITLLTCNFCTLGLVWTLPVPQIECGGPTIALWFRKQSRLPGLHCWATNTFIAELITSSKCYYF